MRSSQETSTSNKKSNSLARSDQDREEILSSPNDETQILKWFKPNNYLSKIVDKMDLKSILCF